MIDHSITTVSHDPRADLALNMRPLRIMATVAAAGSISVGRPLQAYPALIEAPVDLDELSDPLAVYLASHVTGNVTGDPGSLVRIIHPWTTAEARLRTAVNLEDEVFLGNSLGVSGAIERLRRRIDEVDRDIATQGPEMFQPVVNRYDWPLFGSVRGGWSHGYRTVEAYLDHCAREIRNLRCAVVAVGPHHERPPLALQQEMSRGRGFDPEVLLAQYDAMTPRSRRPMAVAFE